MTYILPSEYDTYGLDDTTPGAIVAAASALIDAHCNRPTLATAEYTERASISPANTLTLTYLPLVNDVAPPPDQGASRPPGTQSTSPFLSLRVRYASSSREVGLAGGDLAVAVSQAFALPGTWIELDPLLLDYDPRTGRVTLPANLLGLPYAEAEISYHAGFSATPEAVKVTCANIVRAALATPALNVRASSIERMHMEYFAPTLLTPDVRAMLAPYVARRVG